MDKMKRIMFVTNHLYGGGSERVLVSLANKFSELGNEVIVIAFNAKEKYPINKQIIIQEIGDSSSLIKQSYAIRKQIVAHKPDAIISFEYFVNLSTIIAAYRLRTKVIVSERNDPARVGSGLGKDQLRSFLYRYCDVLVCQTPDAKAYFPAKVQEHTTVIPNPLKESLPIPFSGTRKKVVVNFCRLNEQKNLTLLLDAFSEFHHKYNDYRLIIYGDGPEKEKLNRYIAVQKLEDCVELRSNVQNVLELVIDSSMFVSSSDYEGLSNSMLEAMAIGIPTICTDCPCGGARMIIDNGNNGLLVPVNNKGALVNAMERLADNEELAIRLSQNAVKIRENLFIDKIVDKWKELLQ